MHPSHHKLLTTFLLSQLTFSATSHGASHNTDNPKIETGLTTGLNWQTNQTDPTFADPRAKKGGEFRIFALSYPATFRTEGPLSKTPLYGFFEGLKLTLTTIHPNTKNVIPLLATHWAVVPSMDKVFYKLAREAKFSDGKPIVADDYVFTLEFMRSEHIKDPQKNNHYTLVIDRVDKISEEVIAVSVKKPMPLRDLMITTSIHPLPRHFHKLSESWVKDTNYQVEPHAGPYQLTEWQPGKSLTFARVSPWWGSQQRYLKHRFNIDRITILVIRDLNSAWQHFLRGDLHRYGITSPHSWHKKAKGHEFDMGYIRKLTFYDKKPKGLSQFWLNQQQPHWQDQRVRYAFSHSLHFRKVIEHLLYDEYQRLPALYSDMGAPTDISFEPRSFNPKKAAELMKQAGYTLNNKGIWQKGVRQLTVKITYGFEGHASRLIVLQQEAKKAGFDIQIHFVGDAARFNKIRSERNFDVLSYSNSQARSLIYPHYRSYFHSKSVPLAVSTNLTATANKELDALIEGYDASLDEEKKSQLSRKILTMIHEEGAFIPGFSYGFSRIAYQSYWQFPKIHGTQFGELSDLMRVHRGGGLMWFDPEAYQQWQAAKKAKKPFEPEKKVVIDKTYQ